MIGRTETNNKVGIINLPENRKLLQRESTNGN